MTEDSQTLRSLKQENLRLRGENSSLRGYVDRLQQTMSALTILQNSLDKITPAVNVFQLINKILQSALRAVDSKDGSLLLLDEESGDLVFVEVIGDARDTLMHFRLPKGQGVASWVVKNKTPRLVEDASSDPNFSPMVDQKTGLHTSSLICVPLMRGSTAMGAIEVINTESGRVFRKTDMDILQLVARLAALAIERAESTQA